MNARRCRAASAADRRRAKASATPGAGDVWRQRLFSRAAPDDAMTAADGWGGWQLGDDHLVGAGGDASG
jgi:hypothetical protein